MVVHETHNLAGYLDGGLHPEAVRRVERHLETCHLCRRELAELRAARHALEAVGRSAEVPAYDHELWSRVHAQIERPRHDVRLKPRWALATGGFALAATAGAFLILLSHLPETSLNSKGNGQMAHVPVTVYDGQPPSVPSARPSAPAVRATPAMPAAPQVAAPPPTRVATEAPAAAAHPEPKTAWERIWPWHRRSSEGRTLIARAPTVEIREKEVVAGRPAGGDASGGSEFGAEKKLRMARGEEHAAGTVNGNWDAGTSFYAAEGKTRGRLGIANRPATTNGHAEADSRPLGDLNLSTSDGTSVPAEKERTTGADATMLATPMMAAAPTAPVAGTAPAAAPPAAAPSVAQAPLGRSDRMVASKDAVDKPAPEIIARAAPALPTGLNYGVPRKTASAAPTRDRSTGRAGAAKPAATSVGVIGGMRSLGQPLGDTPARHLLARADSAMALGKVGDAKADYQAAVKEGLVPSDERRARLNLGDIAVKAGDDATAVKEYRAAVEIARDSASLVKLGAAEERAGNFKEAKAAYEKALALNPSSSEARAGLSRVKAKLR